MDGKIALEEHFGAVNPDIVSQSEEHNANAVDAHWR
jgi:hypothetical protein